MPDRPIPPRPSLELDRKQARALLEALRRGEPEATERLRRHHPGFRRVDRARAAALHDAQLVIAREYGFTSWPRWKLFVEARQLDAGDRAGLLVRAACEGDMRKASSLLDADPALERFDLYTACACGADEDAARFLARDPSLANRKGGPLDRAPILYACFSRFLRSDGGQLVSCASSETSSIAAPTSMRTSSSTKKARPGSRPASTARRASRTIPS